MFEFNEAYAETPELYRATLEVIDAMTAYTADELDLSEVAANILNSFVKNGNAQYEVSGDDRQDGIPYRLPLYGAYAEYLDSTPTNNTPVAERISALTSSSAFTPDGLDAMEQAVVMLRVRASTRHFTRFSNEELSELVHILEWYCRAVREGLPSLGSPEAVQRVFAKCAKALS